VASTSFKELAGDVIGVAAFEEAGVVVLDESLWKKCFMKPIVVIVVVDR